MLVAPVLVGAIAGGINAWHGPLLIAWLAAFCLNFYVSLSIKSRKPRRYQRQLRVYGAATGAAGLVLVWHDVALLRLLLPALSAFAINVFFVLRRNERDWINDVVGIALAGCVGYSAYLLGAAPGNDGHAARALLAICLYFTGAVIYVKTLIRERGSRTWLNVSRGFHAALTGACLLMGWWIVALVAGSLLCRAIAVPRLGWSPKRVGLTEILWTCAVVIAALVAVP